LTFHFWLDKLQYVKLKILNDPMFMVVEIG